MGKRYAITPEDVKNLEELAREISPIVFWTCNYEPTESYSINEDAMFLDGIQDLYKFAIDTNCVLRSLVYSPKNSIYDGLLSGEERRSVRNHIDTIQMLRSVIDHGQSELNGRYSAESLDSYRSWIRTRLGSERPTSNDDFAILCDALEDLGDALISDCELILNRLRRMGDRQMIVDRWTDATIRWYCTGTRQHYYKGQLADYYIARALRIRPQFLNNTPQWRIDGKVSSWIRSQVTYEYDRLVSERGSIKEHLDHPTAMELKVKSSLPEVYDEMQAQRRRDAETISVRLSSIEADFSRLRSMHRDDKCLWFFDSQRLGNQLRSTIESLESTGGSFTLLPQSLLQVDVELNFKDVPSPDGDF